MWCRSNQPGADLIRIGCTIDYGLASNGQLMSLAVRVLDTPGRLAAILGLMAEHGMNIRHVEHRRWGLHVPMGMTEIILQMETWDVAQRKLIAHFGRQGGGGAEVGERVKKATTRQSLIPQLSFNRRLYSEPAGWEMSANRPKPPSRFSDSCRSTMSTGHLSHGPFVPESVE